MMRITPSFRRDLVWFIPAIIVAIGWFSYNRTLPPLFRGDVCCDSTAYVKIAEQLPTKDIEPAAQASPQGRTVGLLKKAFTYTGYTPPGYPLFLAAHRVVLGAMGLPWLAMSFVTALTLHLGASFFFYRSLKSLGFALHPIALFLIVAHPGLTSHAALPLADSLAITMMMVGLGALSFSLRPLSRRHAMAFSLLTGVGLGAAVLTRTSHLPAATLTMVGWLGLAGMGWLLRRKGSLLLPAIAVLAFGVTLSPRLIACANVAHTFCYSPPTDRDSYAAPLFRFGMQGARTYGILTPQKSVSVTVPDTFFAELSANCPLGDATYFPDQLRCFTRRPASAGIFFVKKAIGLFDNFHMNTYATYVTPPWVVAVNRTFGAMGFVGFFAILLAAAMRALRRTWTIDRFATFIYPLFFFGFSVLIMVESRFGLPLAPFGIAGFVLLCGQGAREWTNARRRKFFFLAIPSIALALIFLVQTSLWDRNDAYPRQSVKDALANPVTEIPEPLIILR